MLIDIEKLAQTYHKIKDAFWIVDYYDEPSAMKGGVKFYPLNDLKIAKKDIKNMYKYYRGCKVVIEREINCYHFKIYGLGLVGQVDLSLVKL